MSPRDPTLLRVGDRLRELREKRGETQEAVASRAGFTAKYLSEVERGTRDIPLSTLRAIVEDGLEGQLKDAFSVPVGGSAPIASERREPLPATVERMAREVAALDPLTRRSILAIVRTALSLTRRTG